MRTSPSPWGSYSLPGTLLGKYCEKIGRNFKEIINILSRKCVESVTLLRKKCPLKDPHGQTKEGEKQWNQKKNGVRKSLQYCVEKYRKLRSIIHLLVRYPEIV